MITRICLAVLFSVGVLAADLASANGLAVANIASVNGVAKASIASVNGLTIASGGSIDDPTDVSNLWAWYKSDVGLVEDDDTFPETTDVIKRWEDQSGNARHLTQATAANKPRYDTLVRNGMGGVKFFSTDNLQFDFTSTSQPFTIFVVAQTPSSLTAFNILIDGNDASDRIVLYKSNTDKFSMFAGSAVAETASMTVDTWYILAGVFNTTSSKRSYNNVITSSLSVGANVWSGMTVGSTTDGTQNWLGYITEIIIYNKALSDTEIQGINTYLNSAARWNAIY